jgi:hypothetical protein
MSKTFPISDETMVVTSSYITEDKLPVLEVSHEDDEEGGSLWQFHCGNGDYSMDKMQLVRLSTMLSLDSSLVEVADLRCGRTAKRSAFGMKWSVEEE